MGLREWWRRRSAFKGAATRSPLNAFDARIDALAARAGALRKAAAGLMAVRRDLDRKVEELDATLASLSLRTDYATAEDPEALAVLRNDLAHATARREQLQDETRRARAQGESISQSVHQVEKELLQIRSERDAARMQLETSSAVLESKAAFENPVDQMLELDAARDEVERAHALAEIYREEAAADSEADPLASLAKPKSQG